jgi:hypothetical protein
LSPRLKPIRESEVLLFFPAGRDGRHFAAWRLHDNSFRAGCAGVVAHLIARAHGADHAGFQEKALSVHDMFEFAVEPVESFNVPPVGLAQGLPHGRLRRAGSEGRVAASTAAMKKFFVRPSLEATA